LRNAIVRLRYGVIAVWVLLALAAMPAASGLSDVLQVEGRGLPTVESARSDRLLRQDFVRPVADFLAIAVHGPVPLDNPAYRNLLDALTTTAAAQPYISQVASYLSTGDSAFVSGDRRSTFFIASIANQGINAAERVTPFRQAMTHVLRKGGWSGYQVEVTGGPALDYDVRAVSKTDAERSELRALPLTAVVLVLGSGALVAAALPIVVGLFAITAAFGLIRVVAAFHPMSVFVLNIVSMIGLGVGIDYSLLMVNRFREELKAGWDPPSAAARTICTAGWAAVTSGLTVALGFAALTVMPFNETRSVAIGGVLVVGVAMLLAVTFLPALLAVLGPSVDGPRWLAARLSRYHAPGAWSRWAGWLARSPYRAIAVGAGVMAMLTWPLHGIQIGLPRAGWFPSGTESGAGVRALQAMGTGGVLLPISVVLQAPAGDRIIAGRYLSGLRHLSDSIRADPRVSQVRGIVDLRPGMSLLQYSLLYSDPARARARSPDFYAAYLSPDNRSTVMDVVLADSTSLTGAMHVVRHIRRMARQTRGIPEGVHVLVGGFAATNVDLQDHLLDRFPLLLGVVVAATALMMFLAFGSLLVPLKAVLMNCLSVAAAFGMIVLVFQQGAGSGLFGLPGPTGAIYVLVPVLVFAIVFGLSMDYEVFLLSRIREEFERTGRNDEATMSGLSATASTITSGAAIMIIVFGAASLSRVLVVQLVGFGLAVAVLLDATVIRLLLVPAIMHVAGRWNWWPGLRRQAGA
jgi:putative drug exporter of the RND superfamily